MYSNISEQSISTCSFTHCCAMLRQSFSLPTHIWQDAYCYTARQQLLLEHCALPPSRFKPVRSHAWKPPATCAEHGRKKPWPACHIFQYHHQLAAPQELSHPPPSHCGVFADSQAAEPRPSTITEAEWSSEGTVVKDMWFKGVSSVQNGIGGSVLGSNSIWTLLPRSPGLALLCDKCQVEGFKVSGV